MTRRRPSRLASVGLAALAALFAGCDFFSSGVVIDGWPVGETFECRNDGECEFYLPVATEALDNRDPGHAPILTTTLHLQAPYLQEDGDFRRPICSGGCFRVVVFQLVDGSVKAIGAGTVGVSRDVTARDYGPLRR